MPTKAGLRIHGLSDINLVVDVIYKFVQVDCTPSSAFGPIGSTGGGPFISALVGGRLHRRSRWRCASSNLILGIDNIMFVVELHAVVLLQRRFGGLLVLPSLE